jgi:recombination DNA repair RAD52 pathway protein
MPFPPETITALNAPLQRDNVKVNKKGFSYIEAWHAIAEANRIFNFDGWSSETTTLSCLNAQERMLGQNKDKPGWGVSYLAKVRIEVFVKDGPPIVREGTGCGHGYDADLGLAHESACKEAESDARKRALMTFGNPFGLALYDKAQLNVSDGPTLSERCTEREKELEAFTDPKALNEWYGRLPQDEVDVLYKRIEAHYAKLRNKEKVGAVK